MTLVGEICALLDDLGLGTYREDGLPGGDIFHTFLPPSPDSALAVAQYVGRESDAGNPWDEPYIQVRVRGPAVDVRVAEQRAQDVYDRLHGVGRRALAGGTWLQLAIGTQSGPYPIGPDEQGRPEFTVNFRVDVDRPTPNRV
ncbi:hypothetical protein ITP53_11285 [Nonomuraea sp. K274]|uniref:Tail terminator n=1 Tax=Nonomuraea cypriaca TaxID=1187855 RepID=A0A931EZM1_9ACTN|nr:minor capsid protein [Nonomuraea cypriaca]MBF8186321.1 hypothetical protein [Nonomuraea cypriaca]